MLIKLVDAQGQELSNGAFHADRIPPVGDPLRVGSTDYLVKSHRNEMPDKRQQEAGARAQITTVVVLEKVPAAAPRRAHGVRNLNG